MRMPVLVCISMEIQGNRSLKGYLLLFKDKFGYGSDFLGREVTSSVTENVSVSNLPISAGAWAIYQGLRISFMNQESDVRIEHSTNSKISELHVISNK